MIGLLIVDDEPAMRSMLSSLFDWDSLGITLVGTANNGLAAMKMINSDVNIVMVDMKMPHMSGQEFITLAKKNFPWLHFIVISGYDTFELVKNTFVLGIEDYFLKSELDPEKVEAALKKTADKILKKREELSKPEPSENSLKAKLFKRIIRNELPIPKAYEETAQSVHSCAFRAVVIKIPEYDIIAEKHFSGDTQPLNYGILNILNEITENAPTAVPFYNGKNEFVIIITDPPGELRKTNVHLLFKQLSDGLGNFINSNITAGISETSLNLKNLGELYRHAETACDYSYIEGLGVLINYENRKDYECVISPVVLIDEVRECLHTLQLEKLLDKLDYIIPSKGDASLTQTETVKQLISRIYYELEAFIQKNNFPIDPHSLAVGKNIGKYGCTEQFKAWLSQEINNILCNMKVTNNLVNKTITYVHQNYGDPNLRLNFIANELGITYNHLSRLFKLKTGIGFNQYLNDIRMKTAMEFLMESNLKLYEIAEKVGYQNYENFSRAFKAYYGNSPKKVYRK